MIDFKLRFQFYTPQAPASTIAQHRSLEGNLIYLTSVFRPDSYRDPTFTFLSTSIFLIRSTSTG